MTLVTSGMSSELVTAPSREPVDVPTMKRHLRYTDNDEDVTIAEYISAARQYAEEYQWSALMTQTRRIYLCDLCSPIVLPRAPTLAVASITYVDTNGDTQTLSSSLYVVDTFKKPGQVIPAYNATWPAVREFRNAVTVTYTCGYGTTPSSVPFHTRQAIKLMVADWFYNRMSQGSVRTSVHDLLQMNSFVVA